MKTNVYVDGFNLYYGSLQGTPYKWLDLAKLCAVMLPLHSINRIRYFTARVQSRPNDPQKTQRQATYIRALETIPNLTVHYGQFLSNIVRMPLASPPATGPAYADVLKTEEKGSDVNIATYLLLDGFEKDYEAAVVISNDSDLVEPIKIVRSRLGLKVGILSPVTNRNRRINRELYYASTFAKKIEERALRRSLFPPSLTDARGTITKPPGW